MTRIEAIERMITTHQIDRDQIGDFTSAFWTEELRAKLLVELADGKRGGIADEKHGTPGQPTMLQIARINSLAQSVWPEYPHHHIRRLAEKIYGDLDLHDSVPLHLALTRRQAARLVIELDAMREQEV